MIKAVVIDDESSAISALKAVLDEYFSFVEVIATGRSIAEGRKILLKHSPDLLFLDIELQDGSGFDLLEAIPVNFKVVFVTAYSEYALKAIKKRAFDYLLKPVDIDELAKTLDHMRKAPDRGALSGYAQRISIACRNGNLFVSTDDILRLEAQGSYSIIFLENGDSYLVSHNLSYFEKVLDPVHFYRCHHSHIINLGKVTRAIHELGTVAILCDGSRVDVSKRKKTEFNHRMNSLTTARPSRW